MTQRTRSARLACLAAVTILVLGACSGGDDTTGDEPDGPDGTESPVDDTDDDSEE